MDRSSGPVVVLALLVLQAAATPVAGNGGGHEQFTEQATFGDYNVTYYSAKGLTGGETLSVGWEVKDRSTGANYTENTTATFTFRDADNATLSESTVNATRFRETEFLVSPVRIAEQARWMDAALALPNATATFGQPIGAAGQDDGGDPPEESTPLPAALAVSALAVAWWIRRR